MKTSFLLSFCAKHLQVRFSDHPNYRALNMFALTGQLFKTADFAVVIGCFKTTLNIKFANYFSVPFCLNILGDVQKALFGSCDILFILFNQYR